MSKIPTAMNGEDLRALVECSQKLKTSKREEGHRKYRVEDGSDPGRTPSEREREKEPNALVRAARFLANSYLTRKPF